MMGGNVCRTAANDLVEKLLTAPALNNVMKKHIFSALVLSAATVAAAQTPKEFLQKSLAAYGPWENLQSFSFAADRTGLNPWQSYSFTDPKPSAQQWETTVDLAADRFRNRFVLSYPGGYVFDFVNIGKDTTRWFYDNNGSRNGRVLQKGGRNQFLAQKTQALQSLVYYALKAVAASGDSLQYAANGNEVVIKRLPKNGPATDYVFDAQTALLKRTERTAGGKQTQTFYDGYETINGLKVQSAVRQVTDGAVVNTERLKRFEPNVQTADALFVPPAGYTLQTPAAPPPLSATAVAKDVYHIAGVGGDRNVLFVALNDYVVLTEAPLNAETVKAVLDVVHKTVPGKPVRYVHLSHHHNDHTGGLLQLVAEGATILVTPPLETPMRAVVKGALGNPQDDFAKNPKEPVFAFINGVKVLEDGDHRVEFHAVPNSHADGLSFLYLPREGIIYQGDLLTVPEDGTVTPAIAVTREFNEYLRKNKITYKRMIGHHSHSNITPALFAQLLSAR